MSLYGKLYRSVLWPMYEKARGRRTELLLKQAEHMQWRSPDEIRSFQWQELQKVLRHAYEYSPWHQNRFRQLGLTPDDIRSLEDFRKLPVVSKEDIRRFREDMVAGNYRGRVIKHKTGGSTGVPLQFYITRDSYEWRNAVTLRGYGWAGAYEGDKTFYLWSVAVDNPPPFRRLKASTQDWVLRRRFFNNFRLSHATLPDCLRSLNQFAPRVLVGYTSMLEYLARYIKKHGGLRVKLHSVITAAEGVNSAQRELLAEVFRAPVYASYGSREFKLIAMECERGGLHLSADNLLVECVRKGQTATPGELGKVIVTDLHNLGMPFIRYELGDAAGFSDRSCPCGRGLHLLESVHGRIPDTIQTPEGLLISGIFFPHLLKEFAWIDEFQVIQKKIDHALIKLVVPDRQKAQSELLQVERKIRQFLGNTIRLDFEFCNEIPRTVTGKHRVTVSEIPVEI